MDAVIYSLSLSAITFVAFLLLRRFDKRLIYAFGVLFAVYVGLDDFATGLPYSFGAFKLHGGYYWNWSGKIYSLLLSLAVILGLGMNAKAVGLTLPQGNVRAGLIALVPLTLVGVVLGLVFKPSVPSAETIAFQALMPSLAEELAFRGVAPALLLGLIRGKEPSPGTPWIAVFIAAVPFSVVHGLGYSNGMFSFDVGHALYTFSGGIIYGWLRFSSGSLLFPVLAHSFANVAFHLVALVGA